MPGRKNPEPTENEKEHEYMLHQKRERGEKLWGEEATFLDEMGGVGEVRERRRAWKEEQEEARSENRPPERR